MYFPLPPFPGRVTEEHWGVRACLDSIASTSLSWANFGRNKSFPWRLCITLETVIRRGRERNPPPPRVMARSNFALNIDERWILIQNDLNYILKHNDYVTFTTELWSQTREIIRVWNSLSRNNRQSVPICNCNIKSTCARIIIFPYLCLTCQTDV